LLNSEGYIKTLNEKLKRINWIGGPYQQYGGGYGGGPRIAGVRHAG